MRTAACGPRGVLDDELQEGLTILGLQEIEEIARLSGGLRQAEHRDELWRHVNDVARMAVDLPGHGTGVFEHIPVAVGRRLQLRGPFCDLPLDVVHRDIKGRLALGGDTHFQECAPAPEPQHDILEDHPGRMLEEAPPLGIGYSIDRFRPEEAQQQMIEAPPPRWR